MDTKFYHITHHRTERYYQAGKIYFAKDAGIGHKGGGCGGEAGAKIIPDGDAAHIKWNGCNTIGRYVGHFTKNKEEHERGKNGLYKMP